MAGVAQLVRASVCGTECRQFESGHPPHKIQPHQNGGVKFYHGMCQISNVQKPVRPEGERQTEVCRFAKRTSQGSVVQIYFGRSNLVTRCRFSPKRSKD